MRKYGVVLFLLLVQILAASDTSIAVQTKKWKVIKLRYSLWMNLIFQMNRMYNVDGFLLDIKKVSGPQKRMIKFKN
ncbi:secreted protein [Candidatus Magnetobacterium bavaricum]|uniref:Secreted protein n=1 Tax=Candidatus Magnetobacterium bavaricum TaxID=29290 RepID=A0A0F3GL44_9BACT|nr:secreted protein [Candidatus Magnetobacterium bavaricum]